MTSIALCYWIGVLVMLAPPGASLSRERFTWGDLERCLRNSEIQYTLLSHSEMLGCPYYAHLDPDEAMLLDMSAQSAHPLVVLAAQNLAEQKYPNLALQIAMRTIVSAEQPAMPIFSQTTQLIQLANDYSTFSEEFSRLVESRPIERVNLYLLLDASPKGFLDKWFHGERSNLVYPIHEAVMLTQLFSEYSENDKPASGKMLEALTRMKKTPGYPQLVYVTLTQDSGNDFVAILRTVLENADLANFELFVPIGKHWKVIQDRIEPGTLRCSKDREEYIVRRISSRRKKAEE